MLEIILFLCIVFPIVMGMIALKTQGGMQKQLVVATGAILSLAAIGLCFFTPTGVPVSAWLPKAMHWPVIVLDFALLVAIFWLGWRRSNSLVMGLALIQFLGLAILEAFFARPVRPATLAFTVDSLSLALVLIVSIIGSIIACYSLGYMREHEAHVQGTRGTAKFFAAILIFLGAMNGLVLSDDLAWVCFFWEATTLCSYFLISYDQTKEAKANADRALWMNLLGGVGFVFALIFLQKALGTLSIAELRQLVAFGGRSSQALLIAPFIGLCFAGFTKSAQIPFQSWLTGAMVAPTPVSALLHSSTMVKAGVYLILRLAPLFQGTYFSGMVAIIGAFTFFSASALAAGQSNGKKILAYSTIANLGLIIACAGINTPASIAAGVMLLIFHAVSKSLLFLCMGLVEQAIGSRSIEDMRGLFSRMPRLATLMTLGIMSMVLPPFGMLLAKWMALESSVGAVMSMPLIVVMLALGSGITVMFWARWAGIMLGSFKPSAAGNKICAAECKDCGSPPHSRLLCVLAGGVALLSLLAPVIYIWLVEPVVAGYYPASDSAFTAQGLGVGNKYGVFFVYPIYIILGLGAWFSWCAARAGASARREQPYMSGMQAVKVVDKDGREFTENGFTGPMTAFVPFEAGNYYLSRIFGENALTYPANIVAIVLLVMLLGGMPSW